MGEGNGLWKKTNCQVLGTLLRGLVVVGTRNTFSTSERRSKIDAVDDNSNNSS